MSKYEYLTLHDGEGRQWMILSEPPVVVGNHAPATPIGAVASWSLAVAVVCGLVLMAVGAL